MTFALDLVERVGVVLQRRGLTTAMASGGTMKVLLLCTALLLLAAPAAVAQDPVVEDVLISTVPDPYELSPGSDGITGTFDAEKAEQLGMPSEPFERAEDAIVDGHIRYWFHPNHQTDGIIALVMKGSDEATAAGMLNGSIHAHVENALTEFDVDIPDGRGFTEPLDAKARAHSVVFRRGLYMFILAVSGPENDSRDLVRALAQAQFDRTPGGATSPEPPPPGFLSTRSGRMAMGAAVGAVFGAIVHGVRRRRHRW